MFVRIFFWFFLFTVRFSTEGHLFSGFLTVFRKVSRFGRYLGVLDHKEGRSYLKKASRSNANLPTLPKLTSLALSPANVINCDPTDTYIQEEYFLFEHRIQVANASGQKILGHASEANNEIVFLRSFYWNCHACIS